MTSTLTRNMNTRSRIMLYTGAILFSIVILIGGVLFSISASRLRKRTHELVEQQISYAAGMLESETARHVQLLYTLYLDRSFHAMLHFSSTNIIENGAKVDQINTYISSLASAYESVPEISLFLLDDNAPAQSNGMCRSAAEARSHSWFNELFTANRTQVKWETVLGQSPSDGSFRATLLIKDRYSGKPLAIAQLTQQVRKLYQWRSSLNLENGDVFLLDTAGNLVYTTGRDNLTYAGALSGKVEVTTQTNPQLQWRLVYVTDNKLLLEDVTSLAGLFLPVLAGIILASIGMLTLSSKALSKRLVALAVAVQKLGDKDPELRFPLTVNDEVSILAHSFNDTLGRLNSSNEANRLIESERYSIELKSLQERVNPHFLYNTLSVISSMAVRIEAYDIVDALNALARFYRASLSHGDGTVTIAEEVELAKIYIQICTLRFGNRLTITLHIDDALEDYHVPKLIIQPFVENAIMHAFTASSNDNRIEVRIEDGGEELLIGIADNGAGMSDDIIARALKESPDDGSRHAMAGADRRLKLHYGPGFGVHICSGAEAGTRIVMNIPKVKPEPGGGAAPRRRSTGVD